MLLWIIQMTIISIILIFLVHNLFDFFKTTLTIPKFKDLVNSPSQKYENIYNIIKNNENSNLSHLQNSLTSSQDYTLIDLLPKEENTNMKSELKNFLKKHMHFPDILSN
jgi:hypothetical protein